MTLASIMVKLRGRSGRGGVRLSFAEAEYLVRVLEAAAAAGRAPAVGGVARPRTPAEREELRRRVDLAARERAAVTERGHKALDRAMARLLLENAS